MALCPPPALLYTACPRVPCWDQSCLPCTPSLCQMWFLSITITSTPMTLSCPKVPHLISSFLFNPAFRYVLMMFCSGWIATSLSWTQIRLRLCPLALHLVLSRSTVKCANIGGNSVPFKTSVKYLGVHLDKTLSMQKHISSICCASFLELRRIASIRPYLSQSAAARLVAAMVISRLDYCNSVFIGLPADQIARLQRVQNNAARLVLKKRRRDHVTPLLKELHWLPVKFRCQYKIATLAYRHFDGSLPPYLSSSLCTYEPSRSLRSSNEKLLKIPKWNLKSFGQRSFSFMAPSLWNSLLGTLRNVPTLSQFKSQLKTLFAQAFL